MNTRRERVITYAFLGFFSALAVLPVLGVLLYSLNPAGVQTEGLGLPTSLHFDTYREAWDVAHFSMYLRASVIVTTMVVIGTTVLSVLAGYAFGTMRFRGSNALFYVLLLGMIVPFEAVIVPLYYDFRDVGLTDTWWALVLPQIGIDVCFGTFWMRAYFRSVPKSLLEAAAVDGAGSFRTLIRVALPPGRPALLTLVVLIFMWSWNEFLLPLVMVTEESLRTAPLGLAFFAGQHVTDRVGQAAASVIVAAPVVVIFVLLQRSFIRGMVAGAIKE